METTPVSHSLSAGAIPVLSKSKSGVSLKRRIDTADVEQRASSKRSKVAFDPEIQIRTLDDFGEKTVNLIREEVIHAIHQHAAGDNEEYDHIKQLFSVKPDDEDTPSSDLLRKYLWSLINNGTLLTRSCSDLVHSVLSTQWLGREESFVVLYIRFLGNLVSSQGGFVSNVLNMLVENFVLVSPFPGRPTSQSLGARSASQDRIHTALKYILQLIPSASTVLSSILASAFPFSTDSKKAHVRYVRNLLKLTMYAPELRTKIFDLIVTKVLVIDVQVQLEVEDLEDADEHVADIITQGQIREDDLQHRETDDDDDDISDTESVSSGESAEPEEQRIKDLQAAVEKMDALLDFLFSTFAESSKVEPQSCFDILLSQFRKTILPTYRSRHTQFLLFKFGQSSPELVSQFTDCCIKILMDKARSSVIRLSAAAYLASFVSRGQHVPTEIVGYVFDSLASYAQILRCEYEPKCRGPDLRKYSTYYATVQALIYIFCFRWRDLLDDPTDYIEGEDDDLIWAPGVKEITQNFTSKLNPLKVCAPEVVSEFCRIAHNLNYLYLFPILELNNRVRLSQRVESTPGSIARDTSLTGMNGERYHQLDAYFPFDPYRLPISKRWLVGEYREWKGVPGTAIQHVQGKTDSSDEDVEAESDVEDQGTATPVESD